jgi:hypothetical protein
VVKVSSVLPKLVEIAMVGSDPDSETWRFAEEGAARFV